MPHVVPYDRALGTRKRALVRMAGDVAMDGALGTIPLPGDILDIAWKVITEAFASRETG